MSKTVDQVYDLLKKDFEHDQAQMAFIFLNFCILCVILVAACASAHARRARLRFPVQLLLHPVLS